MLTTLITASTLLLSLLFVLVITRHTNLLLFLYTKNKDSQLPSATTSLSPVAIVVIFTSIVSKSILSKFSLAPTITTYKDRRDVPAKTTGKKGDDDDTEPKLPELSLRMPFKLSRRDVEEYKSILRCTRKPANDEDSSENATKDRNLSVAHICLLLSALTEPAMLILLAKRECPIQPLGSVNVRNRFELVEPEIVTQILLTARGKPHPKTTSGDGNEDLEVVARCSPFTRAVKRGYECDFIVELVSRHQEGERSSLSAAGGENASSRLTSAIPKEMVIFRQMFTMLQFAKHQTSKLSSSHQRRKIHSDGKDNGKRPKELSQAKQSMKGESRLHAPPQSSPSNQNLPRKRPSISTLKMPASLPKKWAHLCKDYNPIHISTLAARIFGFSGKIAHGCLVVAGGIEAFQEEGGFRESRMDNLDDKLGKVWIEMQFVRPVVVPCSLELCLEKRDMIQASNDGDDENGVDKFEVCRDGKVYVRFQIGKIEGGS